MSENAKEKGDIIFKEREPNRKKIHFMILLTVIGLFVISLSLFHGMVTSDELIMGSPLLTASLVVTMLTGLPTIFIFIFYAFFSEPIVIYENGFEKPSSLLSPSKNRFVPFSDIEEVRPLHRRGWFGTDQEIGLKFYLKDDSEIVMDFLQDLGTLIEVKRALKKIHRENSFTFEDPIVVTMWGKEKSLEPDPIEKAKGLSDEEFIEIIKKIESRIPLILISIGGVSIISGFIISEITGDPLYFLLAGIGLVLISITSYRKNKFSDERNLIKRTVEYELENDDEILPAQIEKIKIGFDRFYRKIPDLSKERWNNIVASKKTIYPSNIFFILFLFLVVPLSAILSINILPLNMYLSFVIPLLMSLALMYYFVGQMRDYRIYRSIVWYEYHSGEKVIPEELR